MIYLSDIQAAAILLAVPLLVVVAVVMLYAVVGWALERRKQRGAR